MDCELPDNFDLIVVGTGMIESIIAAAASRIGKEVLHVDSNDYYGGLSASFNIEGFEKYICKDKEHNTKPDNSKLIKETEHELNLGNTLFEISKITQNWHVEKEILTEEKENAAEQDKENTAEQDKENTATEDKADISDDTKKPETRNESTEKNQTKWTQDRIVKDSRKFNLDLVPKLQFARGEFVELLISSNIARYSEYRSVSRVMTWLNGQLEVVPCSRSDVFSNTKVSVVEKRMLMKLLTTCLDSDDSHFSDYTNKTFYQYLKDKKLTPNLIHYVLYAISMSTKDTPCLKGIENTKRFLNSLGRFGKTPFLYSMYGSGELPQAFCRLCAVFGGTYCLGRPVSSLILDNSKECVGVICANQRITSKQVVMSLEYIPEKYVSTLKVEAISRAVFLTDRPLLGEEKENLTLLLFPPEENKNPVTIIELGPATGTCPPELYIIHMYCKQINDPVSDLEHCVNRLLSFGHPDVSGDSKISPQVLWSSYYSVPYISNCDLDNILPSNVITCPGPDLDLDYDNAVEKAKSIFMKIYPECEFLPRAPDPEEIIICDEKSDTEAEQQTESSKMEDHVPVDSKDHVPIDSKNHVPEDSKDDVEDVPVVESEKVSQNI